MSAGPKSVRPVLEALTRGLRRAFGLASVDAAAKLPCTACNDKQSIDEAYKASCGHMYCHGCLDQLVNAALEDSTLFPPHCCGEKIWLSAVEGIIPEESTARFQERLMEQEVGGAVYCHFSKCAVRLDEADFGETAATCPACTARTCLSCRTAAHEDDCSAVWDERGAMLTEALGTDWQSCSACNGVVSKAWGCDHMTCPCGREFCWICAEDWVNCNCHDGDPDPYGEDFQQDDIHDQDGPNEIEGPEPEHFDWTRDEDQDDPWEERTTSFAQRFEHPPRTRPTPFEVILWVAMWVPNLLIRPLKAYSERRREARVWARSHAQYLREAARLDAEHAEERRFHRAMGCSPGPAHAGAGKARWEFRRGSSSCAVCGDEMSLFLMRCSECDIGVCRRCTTVPGRQFWPEEYPEEIQEAKGSGQGPPEIQEVETLAKVPQKIQEVYGSKKNPPELQWWGQEPWVEASEQDRKEKLVDCDVW